MVSLSVKVVLDTVKKGLSWYVPCKFNNSSNHFKTIIAR